MPTFFDLLPNDVHDRIAHYLFSSTKYIERHYCGDSIIDSIVDDNLLGTLLEYARKSPAQCRSVARAMYGHLHVKEEWRSQTVVDCISILADNLRSLEIMDAPEFHFPGASPQLPKLERAVINVEEDHMSLIHGCPKLSNLTLFIDHYSQAGTLVPTIDSLQLHVLQLLLFGFDALSSLPRVDLMSFSSACHSVEELYLDTMNLKLPAAIWDMIKAMPSLKKLTLNRNIEEEHVPFVQTLQEIGLLDLYDIGKATRFGAAVTHLSLKRARDEDIMQIELLPNLRNLEINPSKGHERALVGMINNVEALTLSWDCTLCVHSGEGVRESEHPVYYEPDIEVLTEILSSAKQLKSLHIKRAIISSDAVASILKIAGGKLETLEICHDWQREPVPTRMERILQNIARYCPNLETLSFHETLWVTLEPNPIFATEGEKKMCFRALEEVAEALPGFKSYRYLRSTILHKFVEQLPGNATAWYDRLQGPCTEMEQ